MMYYEFSGSPKAKDVAARIKKTGEQSHQAMQKADESIKNAIIQKSDSEQKQFEKKKADLEKELGL